MDKYKINIKKGTLSLNYKETPTSEELSLAKATLFEGTGLWAVQDLRLHPHKTPSPYFELVSDDFNADIRYSDENELKFLTSQLREYRIDEAEQAIMWCTYRGMIKGTPTNNQWPRGGPGFFNRSESIQLLQNIKDFWVSQGPNPNFKLKIKNPNIQPTQSDLRFSLIIYQNNLAIKNLVFTINDLFNINKEASITIEKTEDNHLIDTNENIVKITINLIFNPASNKEVELANFIKQNLTKILSEVRKNHALVQFLNENNNLITSDSLDLLASQLLTPEYYSLFSKNALNAHIDKTLKTKPAKISKNKI